MLADTNSTGPQEGFEQYRVTGFIKINSILFNLYFSCSTFIANSC